MSESNKSSERSPNLAIEAAWHDAWKLPDRLLPSQWAERNRYLTAAESAEPGLWRNSRTPYLVGLMDAVAEPGVEEITFVKPTQVGGSETLRNIIGYWIDEDPGPCLIVMPSEAAVRELLRERLMPLIMNSPSLRRHWSGSDNDITQRGIFLDSMPIYFGWAGSPQSLASRPCRYVVFDECDKYPPFAGREADPISLGMERTATYGHRRKVLKISTPTTRNGPIWKSWESSGDRRHFHVPCPHCGTMQPMAWQRVKWDKLDIADPIKRGDVVERGKLAWYECVNCNGRILDHHKPRMLQAGRYVREDGGSMSSRVGFHLDAIYSPWRSFASEAAEFIRAEGSPGATMNVVNSRRAMPFDNVVSHTQPSKIRDKSLRGPNPFVVPSTAVAVFSTVDTQKDWFKIHVGAWSPGFRYQLLHEAVAHTFEEVRRIGLDTQMEMDGGGVVMPTALLIDTGGSRTNEVYEFALSDPGRIIPCKGNSQPTRGRPFFGTKLDNGLLLRLFDTTYFKDFLNRLIHSPDESQWMPYAGVSEQYCVEMSSEHRIVDRKSGREMWEKKTQGARNEAWDCEVLQCLAAHIFNLGMVSKVEPEAPVVKFESLRTTNDSSWLPPTDSWL